MLLYLLFLLADHFNNPIVTNIILQELDSVFTSTLFYFTDLHVDDDEYDIPILVRFLYEFSNLQKGNNSISDFTDLFDFYISYLTDILDTFLIDHPLIPFILAKKKISLRLRELLNHTRFVNDRVYIKNNLFDIVEYFRNNDLYNTC